jgi:hypothetical protein
MKKNKNALNTLVNFQEILTKKKLKSVFDIIQIKMKKSKRLSKVIIVYLKKKTFL